MPADQAGQGKWGERKEVGDIPTWNQNDNGWILPLG